MHVEMYGWIWIEKASIKKRYIGKAVKYNRRYHTIASHIDA
jgi:hypothetical protein